MSDKKLCPRCDLWKPFNGFYGNVARKDGVSVYCRPCMNESNNAARAVNPNPSRENTLLRRYGITLADRAMILAWQDGLCGMCCIPVKFVGYCGGDAACVDHCHTTGLNRGILCSNCNKELGTLEKWGVGGCNPLIAGYLAIARDNEEFLNPRPRAETYSKKILDTSEEF